MALLLNRRKRFDTSFEVKRLLALVTLVNLLLVLFDLSYVPYRNFYRRFLPPLVQIYDPVKGISPHPETEAYLEQVDTLEIQLGATGLQSEQVDRSLATLRQTSLQILQGNTFAEANQRSTLAKIEDELRQFTGKTFARDSFTTFWSQVYLQRVGSQEALTFWNTRIRPLMQSNYYRGIDRLGRATDFFWLLDLPFVLIFAADFVTRVIKIKQYHPQLHWLEAILRRWYDLLLLLPFWRWLRVIPTAYRLHNTGLLNLEPIQAQAHRDFVIGFAVELIEMMGIQVIDQMQATIKRGGIVHWLLHPEARQPSIQVNPEDEVSAIATRVIKVSIYDVLPQVQTELEEILHHNITLTLNQFPVYQQLQQLPGFHQFPKQLTQNLVRLFSQVTYQTLMDSMEDRVGSKLTDRFSKKFRDTLEQELQKRHNLQEIQTLLIDLLEEVKLNYIRGIAEIGIDQLVEEAEQLHRRISTHSNPVLPS
jgi:hypothetical protein